MFKPFRVLNGSFHFLFHYSYIREPTGFFQGVSYLGPLGIYLDPRLHQQRCVIPDPMFSFFWFSVVGVMSRTPIPQTPTLNHEHSTLNGLRYILNPYALLVRFIWVVGGGAFKRPSHSASCRPFLALESRSHEPILKNSGRSFSSGLDVLHDLELTPFRITPGDHRSILKNSSKCRVSCLDVLRALELCLDPAAVTTKLPDDPR